MYGVKHDEEFMGQVTVVFKGLKRSIAKEKQDSEEKIQTGKITMSFYCIIVLMNTCYMITPLNLFLLLHFLLPPGI